MANIVHFGKYYFPDTGGIESVTISLAKGAVLLGHDVTVVCFEKTPAENFEIIDGVKVVRVPISKLISSQPISFKYIKKCFLVARNANLVHLHAPNMLGALCALIIPFKKKLLIHWHSDVLNKAILQKVLRPLEYAMLFRANSIVATSSVYAEASTVLSSFKKKISLI